MIYLHSQNIIHRDLKPSNILIEDMSEARVKICDFGISSILTFHGSDLLEQSIRVSSPHYAAPELLEPNQTNAVDVFSFGFLLWELTSRELPWKGVGGLYLIEDKIKKGERLPLSPNNQFAAAIQKSWQQKADERPTFSELYDELFQNSKNITDTEAEVLKIFKEKNEIPWNDFKNGLINLFGYRPTLFDDIKYIFGETVLRSTWLHLLTWFSPLEKDGGYFSIMGKQQQQQQEKVPDAKPTLQPPVWTFLEIHRLLKAPSFLGWLDQKEIRNYLEDEPVGTYLFRFSKDAPYFAMSFATNSSVAHCRVTIKKSGLESCFFILEQNIHKDLEDIISTYTTKAIPGGTVKLSKPFTRQEKEKKNLKLQESKFET